MLSHALTDKYNVFNVFNLFVWLLTFSVLSVIAGDNQKIKNELTALQNKYDFLINSQTGNVYYVILPIFN